MTPQWPIGGPFLNPPALIMGLIKPPGSIKLAATENNVRKVEVNSVTVNLRELLVTCEVIWKYGRHPQQLRRGCGVLTRPFIIRVSLV